MAALMTPRFVVSDEEIRHVNEGTCDQIPREQQERILAMLPATMRFRVNLRPFLTLVRGDLFVKLAASRGDDLCYILLLPAHNLWKYQVCNIMGEVAEMISKRFGIYVHFSDLELATWDGQPIHSSEVHDVGSHLLIPELFTVGPGGQSRISHLWPYSWVWS